MSNKDWDEVARVQFELMPKDFRDDWQDFRKKVQGR